MSKIKVSIFYVLMIIQLYSIHTVTFVRNLSRKSHMVLSSFMETINDKLIIQTAKTERP